MDAAAPPENMQALLFAADRFRSVLTERVNDFETGGVRV